MADISINHNFDLPPGVIDMRYEDVEVVEDSVETDSTDTIEVDYASVIDQDYVGAPGSTDMMVPPDDMTIISQVMRTNPGAGQVVDVTIEIDDSSGTGEYGVRLTKV